MTTTTVSLPRPAATILLLREEQSRIEVLMVRRHANLAFMAGMWVFPGGSLHAADMSDAALALLDVDAVTQRMSMVDLHGQPLPAKQVAGLAFAACRETFEETGVLLATHADGRAPTSSVLEQAQRQRKTISESAPLFIELLQQNELRPDLASLAYWAHWITPSSAPKRFDTRFFIVRAPQANLASADTGETVESVWMTPQDLLRAARQRDMPISHPTQCNLHDLQTALARYGSLDELLAGEMSRKVPPILPKMFREDDRMSIVMPWDAAYEAAPGDGLSVTDCGALLTLPSRVLLDH
jgi:8-oxo-dGTP pyrophosphatase MutT (NUDIX family)